MVLGGIPGRPGLFCWRPQKGRRRGWSHLGLFFPC
nr:MAG TPA: hypothetical protein [Caudoviricetes sp.]